MMQSTDFLAVKNYFENLVAQSTHLKDFTGIFSKEFFNKKDSFAGLQSPVLAMFKYELGYESQGQNKLAVRKLGFSIMFGDMEPNDFAMHYQKISEAEILANKVLARIEYDSYQQNTVMYNCYLPNTVQILPVELSYNHVGVDVFLSIKNAQNTKVLLEDWKDLENICP